MNVKRGQVAHQRPTTAVACSLAQVEVMSFLKDRHQNTVTHQNFVVIKICTAVVRPSRKI